MARKRPTAITAAEKAVPQEEVVDDLLDVRVDELSVTWNEDTNEPKITVVRIVGEFVFDIHEETDDDGNVIFTSGLFQTEKDDLRGALELGVKNAAKRAFVERYEFLYPPEPRTIVRRNYKAEVDVSKRQIEEIRLSMKEGRAPNWEAAGVPAPDDWDDA